MCDLQNELKIFAGRSNPGLTKNICDHIGIPLGKARTESFPDGELIVKLDEDVRGRDCFIVQPTCQPVNDTLIELLIWVDCLMRASAMRITAVVPYFGYARQDRKSEGRTPITAKMVANIITAAGVDRVIAMDLHAAQVQGFFDLPVDHLLASPVFVAWYKKQLLPPWLILLLMSVIDKNIHSSCLRFFTVCRRCHHYQKVWIRTDSGECV